MNSHKEQKILDLISTDFDQVGFSPFSKSLSLDFYKDWIDEGMHGNMEFLVEHFPQKESPERIHPDLKSCIAVSISYHPHPKKVDLGFSSLGTSLKIGAYAQGEDYHYWLKEKLEGAISKLSENFPNEVFLAFTDSGPVLERDLAVKSGLGWTGKNTCVIHPKKGSLFFIGEILTSLDLNTVGELVPDRCGTCTRCIDACPTDALTERKLDARKCISYLSIEHKSKVDDDLADKVGPWYFGCDICQLVCPWNEKLYGKEFLGSRAQIGSKNEEKTYLDENERELLVRDLKGILESSNKSITKRFRGTPLTRANGNMHKRNALLVAANYELAELVPVAVILRENTQSEFLKQSIDWFVEKLST